MQEQWRRWQNPFSLRFPWTRHRPLLLRVGSALRLRLLSLLCLVTRRWPLRLRPSYGFRWLLLHRAGREFCTRSYGESRRITQIGCHWRVTKARRRIPIVRDNKQPAFREVQLQRDGQVLLNVSSRWRVCCSGASSALFLIQEHSPSKPLVPFPSCVHCIPASAPARSTPCPCHGEG